MSDDLFDQVIEPLQRSPQRRLRGRITETSEDKFGYQDSKGNDYIFKSPWEREFAIACDQKGVWYFYEPHTFRVGYRKKFTYTPDFFLPYSKTYIEIKGRQHTQNLWKVEEVRARGKKVLVLRFDSRTRRFQERKISMSESTPPSIYVSPIYLPPIYRKALGRQGIGCLGLILMLTTLIFLIVISGV